MFHLPLLLKVEDPYECKDCDARFSTNDLKLQHFKTVHIEGNKCVGCPLEFPTEIELTKHVDEIHKQEKSRCYICQKVLFNDFYVKAHIERFHEGQKSRICSNCDKGFLSNSVLKLHIRHNFSIP